MLLIYFSLSSAQFPVCWLCLWPPWSRDFPSCVLERCVHQVKKGMWDVGRVPVHTISRWWRDWGHRCFFSNTSDMLFTITKHNIKPTSFGLYNQVKVVYIYRSRDIASELSCAFEQSTPTGITPVMQDYRFIHLMISLTLLSKVHLTNLQVLCPIDFHCKCITTRAGYWHKFHNSIWFRFTSLQFDPIQIRDYFWI